MFHWCTSAASCFLSEFPESETGKQNSVWITKNIQTNFKEHIARIYYTEYARTFLAVSNSAATSILAPTQQDVTKNLN